MAAHIIIYVLAFIGIWLGSGLAVKSVERLSHTLKMSSFVVSFVVLGFFTSMSELSVGVNAVLQRNPEIFVGNLIGASIVIFMLIVPLLAVVGRSIRITPELRGFNLLASLVVVALPVILALDGRIGRRDSFVTLALFGLLIMCIQTKKSLWEKVKSLTPNSGLRMGKELLRIAFGVATIFVASRFVVQETLYFSQLWHISSFLMSLLLVAVGTNIPELSLVLRAAFMRNNQVAFGDYVGSAAFNTFLLGALTILNGKPVLLTNSYVVSLLFLIIGLILFYFFARSKHTISRLEGSVLFGLYLLFVATEIFIHR